MRDVNNRRGSFSLSVPIEIEFVSFLSIAMFRKSFFEVTYNQNNAHILDNSHDSAIVKVEQLIDISSNSNSILKNTELFGRLSIHDDSSLSMIGKSNISEDSEINLIFKKSWNKRPENPVINIEKPIQNSISKIVLSSDPSDSKIDVIDFPIIGSDSFTTCDEVGKRIQFEKGKKGDISHKCQTKNGYTFLSVTAKEKKDKLGAGAIAGIVIACIAVVAIIIILIVYLIKRKKYNDWSDDQNFTEVSEIQV